MAPNIIFRGIAGFHRVVFYFFCETIQLVKQRILILVFANLIFFYKSSLGQNFAHQSSEKKNTHFFIHLDLFELNPSNYFKGRL